MPQPSAPSRRDHHRAAADTRVRHRRTPSLPLAPGSRLQKGSTVVSCSHPPPSHRTHSIPMAIRPPAAIAERGRAAGTGGAGRSSPHSHSCNASGFATRQRHGARKTHTHRLRQSQTEGSAGSQPAGRDRRAPSSKTLLRLSRAKALPVPIPFVILCPPLG